MTNLHPISLSAALPAIELDLAARRCAAAARPPRTAHRATAWASAALAAVQRRLTFGRVKPLRLRLGAGA